MWRCTQAWGHHIATKNVQLLLPYRDSCSAQATYYRCRNNGDAVGCWPGSLPKWHHPSYVSYSSGLPIGLPIGLPKCGDSDTVCGCLQPQSIVFTGQATLVVQEGALWVFGCVRCVPKPPPLLHPYHALGMLFSKLEAVLQQEGHRSIWRPGAVCGGPVLCRPAAGEPAGGGAGEMRSYTSNPKVHQSNESGIIIS